jgi:Fe-S oxidoreductase
MNFLKLFIRCEKCKKIMISKGWEHESELKEDDLSGIVMECPICKYQIKTMLGDW